MSDHHSTITDLTELVNALGPLFVALTSLIAAIASSTAVLVGWLNRRGIKAVHEQGNGTAERTTALAMHAGLTQGNLEGRAEQTEERRVEAQKKER